MVANTVEEFNPRDFSTCSTPRYVICVGVGIIEVEIKSFNEKYEVF